jgi:hypothetical protein
MEMVDRKITSPWTTWTSSNDFPCFFSTETAAENANILTEIFSPNFFNCTAATASRHPLVQEWNRVTGGGFLALNSLAEDLKLFYKKHSLDAILRDLKNECSYEPTRHTLRTAAFFERATPGSFIKFFDDKNDTTPDFLVTVDGLETPVEAKLLTKSDVEQEFERVAECLHSEISEELARLSAEDVGVFVVIRDVLNPPVSGDLLTAIRELVPKLGTVIVANGVGFNLQIERLPARIGVSAQRTVYFLSPIHEKDYLRIQTPARKASKQLRASNAVGPGILALGLTHHMAPAVWSFLKRRMAGGSFKGVSLVLMSKTGTLEQPPRYTTLDMLGVWRNLHATMTTIADLRLAPLDACINILEAEPWETDQPAYRSSEASAIISPGLGEVGQLGVFLPDIRRIQNSLLTAAAIPPVMDARPEADIAIR